MKTDNLKLWNKVQRTDPKHTKNAKISGMSITAVAPQYQILNATREFGVYGQTWGFKNIEFDFTLLDKFKLVVFKGTFFSPNGGECQIVNSSKIYMDRAETMVDTDFAKKMETDALTKVLSKMGFNADIFMGRFDDVKYVNEMKEEFKEVVKKPTIDTLKLEGCEEWSQKQMNAVINKYDLTVEQLGLINK